MSLQSTHRPALSVVNSLLWESVAGSVSPALYCGLGPSGASDADTGPGLGSLSSMKML